MYDKINFGLSAIKIVDVFRDANRHYLIITLLFSKEDYSEGTVHNNDLTKPLVALFVDRPALFIRSPL
jgi:hypothetical protein